MKCSSCGVVTSGKRAKVPGQQLHTADCYQHRFEIEFQVRKAKEYNGWTNYETWAVNLWIDNEEHLADERRERARAIIRENITDGELDRDSARWAIADWLKGWVSDEIPETFFSETVAKVQTEASMYADLLGAALAEVDWQDLASHDVDNEKAEILAEVKADADAETDAG